MNTISFQYHCTSCGKNSDKCMVRGVLRCPLCNETYEKTGRVGGEEHGTTTIREATLRAMADR